MSLVHAWDEVWRAVDEAGVRRPYEDPKAPYLPVGENGVSYGQMVVDRVEELRQTRITSNQILAIAGLIRAIHKSTLASNRG